MRSTNRRLRLESLEHRRLLAVSPIEMDGVGYFVSPSDASISRYDVANERWLSPIALAEATTPPDSAHVDQDGIYVAFGREIYRYDLSGGTRLHLLNTSSNVIGLHSDGNVLFVNHSAGLYTKATSIDKTTNAVIDTIDAYVNVIAGSSIAVSHNRLLGRSQGISPSDVTFVDYDDSGNFLGAGDSPYHGDFAGASRTWVFQNERYVIDDSGNLYTIDTLIHSGKLGNSVTDIAFHGGTQPVVLDGSVLTAYTNGFLPAGSFQLEHPAQEILVNQSKVLAFRAAPEVDEGFLVEAVELSQLNAPEPSETVNPVGLPYRPDDAFITTDGSLMLYSREHQSIFGWDPVTGAYSQSIRLLGSPEYVAYSEQLDVLYTAYSGGLIRKIDLAAGQTDELPFAQLPASPLGLVAAGSYLVAEDASGAWTTLNTIAADGTFVDSKEWHYPSSGLIWSDLNQEIFYFSGWSPSDLHARRINADPSAGLTPGLIGADRNTPLHGSPLIKPPVRISPDGSTAVLGSGGIFDVASLAPTAHSLANSVTDLAWLDDKLFSVRNIAGVSQVQSWAAPTYAQTLVRQFGSEGLRLFAIGDNRLLLVTSNSQGIPEFHILDADLKDAGVPGDHLQLPNITWTTPDPLLGHSPLSDRELSATSDVDGTLTYSPAAGTFLPPGAHQLTVTFDPADPANYRSVSKSVSIEVLGVDFGDAPEASTSGFANTYPVTLEQNGAHHILSSTLHMGAGVDAEIDGTASVDNAAGDNAEGSDEDGVRLSASMFSLGEESSSSLSIAASGAGLVDAWIDFNADGDWDDENEQILASFPVVGGANLAPFDVPTNASPGEVGVRVRLSSAGGLAARGSADDGEVEDYLFRIQEAGNPIEIAPFSADLITIDYSSDRAIYRQSGKTLGSYPRALFNIYSYQGDSTDETILLEHEAEGEVMLVGDAGPGIDRIAISGPGQSLNFINRPPNGIRNVEIIDLRGHGGNRLILDAACAMELVGEDAPLKIYREAADELFLDGTWSVEPRGGNNDESYHVITSGDATVHIVDDTPLRNPINPTDVDRDGTTSALDALRIIHALSRSSAIQAMARESTAYVDVNGDGTTTPLDALRVINRLNRDARQASQREPESEEVFAPVVKLAPPNVGPERRH